MNYTITEISQFLKTWGTAFKQLDPQKYPQAEAYYQACVDAHLHLSQKPLRFYTIGGLRRTLLLISDDFLVEYTSRRQGADYKERAELLTYIANNLLQSLNEGVQTKMF